MRQEQIDKMIERNKATVEHLKQLRPSRPGQDAKPGHGPFHFHNRKARSMTAGLRARWLDVEAGRGNRELFDSQVEVLKEHSRLGGVDFERTMEFIRHEVTFQQILQENREAAREKKRQQILRQKAKFRNRHKRRTR